MEEMTGPNDKRKEEGSDMSEKPAPGAIAWTDLTVSDAEEIRDFYARVVGWVPEPVSMGDYADFNMTMPGSGEPVAGICHARGVNAGLPPVWMVYLVVENLDQSLAGVRQGGGEVLIGPKAMGPGSSYAVIRDPAGAAVALYEIGR
jgi:predicted enzyme related to lactoylglutathione lyase